MSSISLLVVGLGFFGKVWCQHARVVSHIPVRSGYQELVDDKGMRPKGSFHQRRSTFEICGININTFVDQVIARF